MFIEQSHDEVYSYLKGGSGNSGGERLAISMVKEAWLSENEEGVVPAHRTCVLDIIFTPKTYKDVFYTSKLFENIFSQASIRVISPEYAYVPPESVVVSPEHAVAPSKSAGAAGENKVKRMMVSKRVWI
ncbi:hypothetical protein Tco_0954833 [Tanacetum coccineum]|uniref:Uncharacterized protein n=1 Tax=Tanacetum coccineum TaxID=301880 RepID=A0ABQ5E5K6_9ASTR